MPANGVINSFPGALSTKMVMIPSLPVIHVLLNKTQGSEKG
jgi:hypothetical protein